MENFLLIEFCDIHVINMMLFALHILNPMHFIQFVENDNFMSLMSQVIV
jgi:hypothetical protein